MLTPSFTDEPQPDKDSQAGRSRRGDKVGTHDGREHQAGIA